MSCGVVSANFTIPITNKIIKFHQK